MQIVRKMVDSKVLVDIVEMRLFPLDSNQPENIKSFDPRKFRGTLKIDMDYNREKNYLDWNMALIPLRYLRDELGPLKS